MVLLKELDDFFIINNPEQPVVISRQKRASNGKLFPVDKEGLALLKDLPKGEFFKRKRGAKTVYTREHYNRDIKKYTCSAYEDVGKDIFLKSNTKVVVGFTY